MLPLFLSSPSIFSLYSRRKRKGKETSTKFKDPKTVNQIRRHHMVLHTFEIDGCRQEATMKIADKRLVLSIQSHDRHDTLGWVPRWRGRKLISLGSAFGDWSSLERNNPYRTEYVLRFDLDTCRCLGPHTTIERACLKFSRTLYLSAQSRPNISNQFHFSKYRVISGDQLIWITKTARENVTES